MGTAIGQRLLDSGYNLAIWNRNRQEAEALIDRGAGWGENPLALCKRVIICLYSSQVVGEVLQQLGGDLQSGTILIDTTTGDPDDVIRLGIQLTARGVHYLDAPVSGSSAQTRDGQVMMMVSGDPAAFESCADLWRVLATGAHYLGASGSASRMKLVTNLVLGLNRAALAEGLAYAAAMGLEPAAALHVLRDSAAASRVMDTKGEKMIRGEFSPQARLSQHLKDVQLLLRTATAAGLQLPLSETHRHLLERAEQAGWGEWDNSAIIRLYQGDLMENDL